MQDMPGKLPLAARVPITDTVGELKSAEMSVPHMPTWKAKTVRKLTQEGLTDVLCQGVAIADHVSVPV